MDAKGMIEDCKFGGIDYLIRIKNKDYSKNNLINLVIGNRKLNEFIVDVARLEGNKLHIFSHKIGFLASKHQEIIYDLDAEKCITKNTSTTNGLVDFILTIGINMINPLFWKRQYIESKYNKQVEAYQDLNLKDLGKAVENIKVYQGAVGEVSNKLGKELEMVDTKNPETFIRACNSFKLRVKAYLMGADAVVHCQPGSSIGTPVKYKSILTQE